MKIKQIIQIKNKLVQSGHHLLHVITQLEYFITLRFPITLKIFCRPLETFYPQLKAFYPPLEVFHPSLEAFHLSLEAFHPQLEVIYLPLEAFHPSLEAFHPQLEALYPPLEAFREACIAIAALSRHCSRARMEEEQPTSLLEDGLRDLDDCITKTGASLLYGFTLASL